MVQVGIVAVVDVVEALVEGGLAVDVVQGKGVLVGHEPPVPVGWQGSVWV
ncbi:MAG TPA: hypothetical protein VJ761_05865 [Ktedonobacteraceae bacterium]|nr:hypothetical protein [Ktedonobacteraceae bacterium]